MQDESTVLLQRGYCVKSPPQEQFKQRRWHKRWCTLSVEEIKDLDKFYKKQNKGQRGKGEKAVVEKLKYLILSYFKEQADEDKNKPIKRFILDGAQIADEPGGTHGHQFAIRIQLSADHNSRLMYLCLDNKEEHQIWLSQLTGYFERDNRKDSIEVEKILRPSLKFKSVTDSPLQKDLLKFRKEMSEERGEIARKSLLEDTFGEYNPYNNNATFDDEYPGYSGEGYCGKSKDDKCFEDLNLEPGNTDSGVFVD